MKTIAQQLNVKQFPFRIKDTNGNLIYWENSNGYWEKIEYDSNGDTIYYENSYGAISDDRPKTVEPIPEKVMKNIHLIPTGKPSRLFKLAEDLYLNKEYETDHTGRQHIYITSDEEIKEGDWILFQGFLTKALQGEKFSGKEKIILTTDQDLIKDGIQAIDNEFLEWFVKNQDCEEIEVVKEDVEQPRPLYPNGNHKGERVWIEQYKIIIPKEESKPHILSCCRSLEECYCDKKPKQETPEEAAKWITKKFNGKGVEVKIIDWSKSKINNYSPSKLLEEYAQWQAERMYSEEEVYNILVEHTIELFKKEPQTLDDFFKRFKKKEHNTN